MKRLILSFLIAISAFASFAQSQYTVTKPATASVSNTYTAGVSGMIAYGGTNYTNSLNLLFKAGNTGSATLNINGLGATTMKKMSSGSLVNLASGDIIADRPYAVHYDGTFFIIDVPSAGGGGSGNVESVTGDGVDNTDPDNPVIRFPTLKETIEKGNDIDDDESVVVSGTAILSIGSIPNPTALQIDAAGTIAINVGSDATGDMYRRSSGGVLERRTPTQVRTDISAQPLSTPLTSISGLTPSNDDFLQYKSSAWANRTIAQVKTDLGLTGTNSGDQTTIVGITGTKSQFNTALTGGDFAFTDWPTVTKTASFVADLADAGTNCYHITSGTVTITFPTMTGLDGTQWGFYVEPAASAVFDFGAVTANGARHLPDSTIIYARYSSAGGGKFIIMGTNPGGSGGSGTVTNVSGTLPISVATGTTTPVISIADAAADGTTKGAATFTAADFNASASLISIDYPNGQAATSGQDGFLQSADWSTFNGKQAAITFGTGVLTALGVNVGSAGAPVLFNGAGGTPSSLTLTNATGLPVPGGGTGNSSLTAYAVMAGGTTSTGATQQVSGVGSSGQILTSNGAAALPTWQNAAAGFANPMTTAGDIIYGAGSGTPTRLATGSGFLKAGTTPSWSAVNLASAEVTGDLALSNIAQIGTFTILGNTTASTADAAALSESSVRDIVFNTKKYDRIYSTFLGGTSEFLSSNSGTGALVSYSATGGETNHNGIARMATGITTTGLSFLRSGSLSAISPGIGEISYDAVIKTEGNLSDGTDTYIIYAGLANDNSAEPAHGLYFRYSHSVNSGKWQLISRASSSETAVDAGITVAVNTYYRFTIILNAAGTSAEGFINGSSIGTITTNLPISIFGITTGIRKTAGINSRNLDCDFVDVIIELTSSK